MAMQIWPQLRKLRRTAPFTAAAMSALAVTIIGLPMAWANLKLIPVTLFPLGKRVVPSTTAFGTVAP